MNKFTPPESGTKELEEAQRNCIVIDTDVSSDWSFKEYVERGSNEGWTVYHKRINTHTGWDNVKRYANYFSIPFRFFRKRKEYKRLLCWQQFFGLIFAFYCRLFHAKHYPEVTVMTFIYKPKAGLLGGIYHWFISYIITSKYIAHIVVFSSEEKRYYAKLFNISEEKFFTTDLGIERIDIETTKGDYFVAAGRSNRDYAFLRNCFPETEKLVIICDTCKEKDTENIHYETSCHGTDYHKLMAHCKGVIVPLQDTHISSGQLVILHAMMFGKPVIITENDTVRDYITDKVNGLIIPKTEGALVQAISSLNEETTHSSISDKALQTFNDRFSIEQMGLSIGEMIKGKAV